MFRLEILRETRITFWVGLFSIVLTLFGACNKKADHTNDDEQQARQKDEKPNDKKVNDSSSSQQEQQSGLPISPLQDDGADGQNDNSQKSFEQLNVNPRAVAEQLNNQGRQYIEPPMDIDQDLVAAAGIQRIQGQYVDIYTDVRDRKNFLEFAKVFDQAVPQWCEYFDIERDRVKNWKLSGFVVLDKDRFRRAGLFPDHLPEFLAGWQYGHEFWVYPQEGEYYTRHLVLHEGTHAFMNHFLKGTGAPWYSEGMAELLALHKWEDGQLQLRYRVKNTHECPYWGRVGEIRDDQQQDAAMTFEDVFQIESRAFLEVRSYAWAWAACEFFDSHPLTHEHFKTLQSKASDHTVTFSRNFKRAIFENYPRLQVEWEMFINEVDYGYDVKAAAIQRADAEVSTPLVMELNVSRAWQSTGVQLQAGQKLKIQSTGRYHVAYEDNELWPCEADGITIEYYKGRPLGRLIAAVQPGSSIQPGSPLSDPTKWIDVGSDAVITASQAGTLFLRINESPARLNDNVGAINVSIRASE